jgi:hypothetical protein
MEPILAHMLTGGPARVFVIMMSIPFAVFLFVLRDLRKRGR